jgi:7-cyano-7-deazaguanine synthase
MTFAATPGEGPGVKAETMDHSAICPHPNPLPKGEGTSVETPAKPAVILLSGGLDSATAAAIARSQGFALYPLSVDYGQRHRFELQAARRVAEALGVARHVMLSVDLAQLGHSALTDAIDVPKDRPTDKMTHGIPITYVPARNTVLLSLALAYAEVVDAADIFLGVNAIDYSGYPDCRPEYIDAFTTMANLATKASVEGRLRFTIHAPLLHWSKAEIIRRGIELGVDYSLTHSCYDPDSAGVSCGRCDACQLRRKGFADAGLEDPLKYQTDGLGIRDWRLEIGGEV